MPRQETTDRSPSRTFALRRPTGPSEPWCVLIADDDDELRELLSRRLSEDGYDVIEARSGTELLEQLASVQLRTSAVERIDLVVSDIRMPGWSGLQVLQGLRGSGWVPPVILMTAYPEAVAHRRGLELGAAATFEKPFDVDDLRTAILHFLPGRSAIAATIP